MFIESRKFTPDQIYFLMIQTIIPRPIAWVLSDNGNATYNLAPFSFFNGITSEPPLLMIAAGLKDDGTRKDTWVNIEERKEFVVHVPSGEIAQNVVASAADWPHGVSEIDKLNMTVENVPGMRLPRVVGAKVAFFCTRYAIYEVGEGPQGLILGQIQSIWLDDSIVAEKNGRFIIDYGQFNPLSRLGGHNYALLGETLTLKRP